MRKAVLTTAIGILLAAAAGAQQPAQKQQPRTLASEMDRQLKGLEGEFVPAAEAMPEDKFDFAPTNGEFKGVRNFGQQVKHVAAVNYIICASMTGEKPPVDTGGENGPDTAKSKDQITSFLKDSFAYCRKAYSSLNEKNAVQEIKGPFGGTTTRLGLATLNVGHNFDHYGQMVEYLRMNGIIPPASRPQQGQ